MKELLFEKCKGYLTAQAFERRPEPAAQLPAVTISRETGGGAVTIAQSLADYLQHHQADPSLPWAVFDRELIKKVLDDNVFPAHFAHYLAEDASNPLQDAFESILGLHPGMSTLVRCVTRTIFNLARRGNVILVGRGSNIITASFKHVLHVRLIASREARIENLERYYLFGREDAEEFLVKTDKARKRYVRQNFSADIDDPLAYHLVINTGRLGFDASARVIGEAVLDLQRRLAQRATARQPSLAATR